jgi:hexosaminidase
MLRASHLALAVVLASRPTVLVAQDMQSPRVLPRPSQVTATSGAFTLKSPVVLVVPKPGPRVREIANLLAEVVRARTGFSVRVGSDAAPGAIVLDTALSSANAEAYELSVKTGGIAIHAASSAGLLWGVQTLRQLLPIDFDDAKGSRPPSWTVPAVDIRDEPRFPWRGSLVDAGRHFFPVATIKKQIDVLSRYKMNVFHWHLTEDQGWRIEIKRYPRLTSVGAWRTEADGSRYGGFYTQNDIRDVVEFARLRGVTVVPEIEMPGHSSAALASYPELGCTGQPIAIPISWGVFADIYCAGSDHTFEFLTNVLDEVLALFPSKYIHIGGDEVPKDRWKACDACQAVMRREGLANENELQSWFVRRIGDYLTKHGRTLVGWDEILEGGLFAGAAVQAWRDTGVVRSAAMQGHDVIASPSGLTYFSGSPKGLSLDRAYSFDPMPKGMDDAAAKHIIGGEAALWSEHITSPANLDLMAFPRMLALSEALWSNARDSASFHARLDSDHIPRLRAMGVAVGPTDRDIATIAVEYDTTSRAARVRTTYGAPGVVVRGTTDGTVPTASSPIVADASPLTGDGWRRLQPFYGNERILAERTVQLVNNKATGRGATVAPLPSRQYPGTGRRSLTDGLLGGADHADGLWQGWIGVDFEVVVDLGSMQTVDTIRTTFLQNVRSWILFPSRVEFAVSDDGAAWRTVGQIENRVPAEREGVVLQGFEAITTARTRAQFVRVVVRNGGRLPAWHPGAGRPSWVFADEIVVK